MLFKPEPSPAKKEFVPTYTLLQKYSCTGFFLSLGMHVRKHITSSEKANASLLLFEGRLTLQITPTITQVVLQNSEEFEAKAHRSLLF